MHMLHFPQSSVGNPPTNEQLGVHLLCLLEMKKIVECIRDSYNPQVTHISLHKLMRKLKVLEHLYQHKTQCPMHMGKTHRVAYCSNLAAELQGSDPSLIVCIPCDESLWQFWCNTCSAKLWLTYACVEGDTVACPRTWEIGESTLAAFSAQLRVGHQSFERVA